MKPDLQIPRALNARAVTFLCLLLCLPLAAQQLAWYAMDDGSGYPRGMRMTVDPAGNTYGVGWLGSSPDMDPGPGTAFLSTNASAFVRKLDTDGQYVWSVGFDVIDDDPGATPFDICLDEQGNILVTGEFEGTVDFDPSPAEALISGDASGYASFVCKLDPNGAFLWARGVSSSIRAARVATDPQGNVWVSGHFTDPADFDPGPGIHQLDPDGWNGFVWKLGPDGSFQWAGMLSGAMNETWITDIATNALGSVFVTGYTYGESTVDFDLGPGTHTTSHSGYNVFVLKLENNGAFAWVVEAAGVGATGIDVDDNGDVVSSGYLYGPCDMDPGPGVVNMTGGAPYAWKLSDAGDLIWARQLGTIGEPVPVSVATYGPGIVILAGQAQYSEYPDLDPGPGTVEPTVGGGSHFYVTVLDPEGDFIWGGFIDHEGHTGSYDHMSWTPAADAAGNIYLGGIVRGITDLDPGPDVVPYAAAYDNGFGDIDVSRFIVKVSGVPLAEQEIDPVSLVIHPNPVDDMLYITTNEVLSGSVLLDASGRPVRQFSGTNKVVDMRDLASGLYVLDVRTASGRRMRTIMKR